MTGLFEDAMMRDLNIAHYCANGSASHFTNVIVLPDNCNIAGFRYLGITEGLLDNPSTLYGSKLQCKLGDIVYNREPSIYQNKLCWTCVDSSSKTFGSVTVAI